MQQLYMCKQYTGFREGSYNEDRVLDDNHHRAILERHKRRKSRMSRSYSPEISTGRGKEHQDSLRGDHVGLDGASPIDFLAVSKTRNPMPNASRHGYSAQVR